VHAKPCIYPALPLPAATSNFREQLDHACAVLLLVTRSLLEQTSVHEAGGNIYMVTSRLLTPPYDTFTRRSWVRHNYTQARKRRRIFLSDPASIDGLPETEPSAAVVRSDQTGPTDTQKRHRCFRYRVCGSQKIRTVFFLKDTDQKVLRLSYIFANSHFCIAKLACWFVNPDQVRSYYPKYSFYFYLHIVLDLF
jgi:hypothetical protein